MQAGVITYNSARDAPRCIESLRRSDVRVLVVDNGSSDGTVPLLRKLFPAIAIAETGANLGYAAAVNLAARLTRSEIFLVCNADVEFSPSAIEQLAGFMDLHRDVAVAGGQLVFPSGAWQKSYGDVPGLPESLKKVLGIGVAHNWARRLLWPRRLDRQPKQVGYVSGAAMAIRRQAFDQVGGFDEAFRFYVEEADFCARVRSAGWLVMFVPSARIMHVGGASSLRVERTDRYYRQWVASKLILMRKAAPAWQIWLYKHLERLHAMQMLWACRAVALVARGHLRRWIASRQFLFKSLLQIWGEECRRPAAQHAVRSGQ